jgi:putative FmdB family regulatory protein
MPIYEYRCDDCSHEFETIQKLSEPPLKTCPACAHETLRKKVSAAGFRLKGAGWYETDFKGGNNKKNVAGDRSSSDTGSSSSSGGKGTSDGSSGSKDSSSGSTSGGSAGSSAKSNGESSKSAGGTAAGSSSSKAKASD